jgi:hypothetical protein
MILDHRSAVALAIASLVLTLTSGAESLRAQESRVPFTRVTIDDAPPARPWYKMLGDIAGDGDLDIVGANHGGDSHPVELWRNELADPTLVKKVPRCGK